MTKERIEIIRQSLIPFVKKELLEINNDGLGKSDAEEFEKDLNEVLDMAIKALEQQQPSEDCVSRKAILEMIEQIEDAGGFIGYSTYSEARYQVNNMSPVTPTFPKGTTNGDVITAMFPSLKIANDGLINDDLTGIIAFYGGYGSPLPRSHNYFNRKWWNAPYKRGNEND